jgi:hypothetical protein
LHGDILSTPASCNLPRHSRRLGRQGFIQNSENLSFVARTLFTCTARCRCTAGLEGGRHGPLGFAQGSPSFERPTHTAGSLEEQSIVDKTAEKQSTAAVNTAAVPEHIAVLPAAAASRTEPGAAAAEPGHTALAAAPAHIGTVAVAGLERTELLQSAEQTDIAVVAVSAGHTDRSGLVAVRSAIRKVI